MATDGVKLRPWISAWFIGTLPVILWDASYCFTRPRSFVGGDLHWIWAPYALWQEVDHVYGLPSYEAGDGFTNAQSLMNLFETAANMAYLYLALWVLLNGLWIVVPSVIVLQLGADIAHSLRVAARQDEPKKAKAQ